MGDCCHHKAFNSLCHASTDYYIGVAFGIHIVHGHVISQPARAQSAETFVRLSFSHAMLEDKAMPLLDTF
eukprot:scaffold370420_cov19-Prasinocladus_malaysianus.AAC.1